MGRATRRHAVVTTAEMDHSDQLIMFGARLTIAHAAISAMTQLFAARLDTVYAIWCVVLAVAGIVLLMIGFWNGVQRSRVDEVTLTGMVAIDSSHVPAATRNRLWGFIVVQVVIGVLLASLRPYTEQTFGLLVPTFGLGVATVWGSRFAAFHPRNER